MDFSMITFGITATGGSLPILFSVDIRNKL